MQSYGTLFSAHLTRPLEQMRTVVDHSSSESMGDRPEYRRGHARLDPDESGRSASADISVALQADFP